MLKAVKIGKLSRRITDNSLQVTEKTKIRGKTMKVNSNSSVEQSNQTSGIQTNNDTSRTNETSFFRSTEVSFTEQNSPIERNLVDRNRILQTGLNNTFAANQATRFDYNQIA